MLSRIRRFQVSCALRCCVVIQSHNQCPTLSGTRLFFATNRAIQKPQGSQVSVDNLFEMYRDKTIIVDYVGDRYGGNMHGVGMITYLNGDTYEGQLEHNQRHGYGKFVSNDGYIYQGEWLNGSMHGAGTIYYDNGDIFNGQFKDNIRQGQGRLVSYRDKSIYEGEFHDLPHGWGELTLENGDQYEGGFQEGRKSAFGTYTAADGSRYEGFWERDRKHGQGKEHAINGDVYVGRYYQGLKVGEGAMTYADGSSYMGSWDADKPNGVGTFTDSSGTVQEGFFVDGVYSTERTQHHRRYTEAKASLAQKERVTLAPTTPPNQEEPSSFPYFTLAEFLRGEIPSTPGTVVPKAKVNSFGGAVTTGVIHYPLEDLRATYEGGLTANRTRHGQGKVTNRDGSTWVGEYKSGQPHSGEGTLVFNNGRVLVGKWKDGKYVPEKVHGKRLISDTDKAGKKPVSVHKKSEEVDNEPLLMYEGEGMDGARHGQGKIIYPDGRTQSGEFFEGQPHQLPKS